MPNGIESTLMLLIAASIVCLVSVISLTRTLALTLPADADTPRRAGEETCAYVVRVGAGTRTRSAAACLQMLKGYWGAVAALAIVTTVVALNAVMDAPPSMWARGEDGMSHLAGCRPSYDTWFARLCLLGGLVVSGYTVFMRMRLTGLIADAYAQKRLPAEKGALQRQIESWLEPRAAKQRRKAVEYRQQFVDSLFDPILTSYEMGQDDDYGRQADERHRQPGNRRGWPLG